MKPHLLAAIAALCGMAAAADNIQFRNTYKQAYGETKSPVAVDPAKDLPRYPAVEPANAVGTWKVKPGFKVELVTHEPFVRDPIAISFDENGRMFVCEMIDYSEERDRTPHLEAAVLPVPVWARPSKSFSRSTIGMACFCIGVGVV
jgi:hypothetical protein